MYVRINGMDVDDVLFTTIVEAETIEEVQEELNEIMILIAAEQSEFEALIKDLGFIIADSYSEVIGSANIQVITEIDTTF